MLAATVAFGLIASAPAPRHHGDELAQWLLIEGWCDIRFCSSKSLSWYVQNRP
jgi:hypothetical protein